MAWSFIFGNPSMWEESNFCYLICHFGQTSTLLRHKLVCLKMVSHIEGFKKYFMIIFKPKKSSRFHFDHQVNDVWITQILNVKHKHMNDPFYWIFLSCMFKPLVCRMILVAMHASFLRKSKLFRFQTNSSLPYWLLYFDLDLSLLSFNDLQ